MGEGYAYQIGWGRQEIEIPPAGFAMHGYGQPRHQALTQRSPLHARALYIKDPDDQALWFCCLDLGYVTYAMREAICVQLRTLEGEGFDEARLVLTCTHTHSGPGGCSHDVLYNLVTPGFQPEHLARVVAAACGALKSAQLAAVPADLDLYQGNMGEEVEVAWNRSLDAYNRNPDVTPLPATQTQRAVDRGMSVLAVRSAGQITALLSLFGVHATCLSSRLRGHDGDNKGYAARHAETALAGAGNEHPVAIFAQATAGDVSPHDQGPRAYTRRMARKGEAEYYYARENGERQSRFALELLGLPPEMKVHGRTDAVLTYIDFTNVKADPAFAEGEPEAWTSEPCHGVAFFAGTPVDGPGMPKPLVAGAKLIARRVKARRLRNLAEYGSSERAYFERLYAAQGAKDILMESGRKYVLGRPFSRLPLPGFADPLVDELKRQVRAGAVQTSAMVPTVLPLQIVTLGALAVVCCPGEFTTVAGRRVRDTVMATLAPEGIKQVLICTYCNDYMGYVTTCEEYQQQAYEGGHTLYGQWTLAAFQTHFAQLAQQLARPVKARSHDQVTRPKPVPEHELALRSNLSPRRP